MTDAHAETPSGRDAAAWSIAAALTMGGGVAGAFWAAPEQTDGPIQRLVFLHVPVALVSLLAFLIACVAGLLYLRTRNDRYDDVIAVTVGLGLLFVILTIVSGSIWARGFWGTWWRWEDPRLVTYLIIGLIYAAFFVLRSSTEESRRARFSAVFAIIAFVAVPLSFYAVRQARDTVHPIAVSSDGLHIDGSIAVWLLICTVGAAVTLVALTKVELLQRRTQRSLARLRAALEDAA